MHLQAGNGVVPSPARPAKVPETLRVTAEEGSRIDAACTAHGVLQVRVDLDLFGEFWGSYFNESSLDGLHKAPCVVERDSARSNRILVLVGIYSCINYPIKEVVHDCSKSLSIDHSMQATDKHCFA